MPLIETLSRLAGARALVHGFLAVAIATGFAIGTPDPAGAQEKSFFKTTAKRSDDLKPFPKWVQVLARYMEEQGKVEGTCKETTFNKCHFKTWSGLIAGLQGQSKKSQLKAVNDYANQALYVRDPKNWGVKDYWASPGQFFAKNGDCEDYAILKFLTLRKLGILGVMQKKKRYILDNQMTLVVEDRRIRHYKPIFSVNETSWWRHKPAKRS
jgi:predicted transglutaminase-like cysteine proteinase